ncbi:MAG: hypothetical protein M3275_00450 [Thermoproteota archaeon]|nr:hypothetical protein [Thermoproteota archaeon]
MTESKERPSSSAVASVFGSSFSEETEEAGAEDLNKEEIVDILLLLTYTAS